MTKSSYLVRYTMAELDELRRLSPPTPPRALDDEEIERLAAEDEAENAGPLPPEDGCLTRIGLPEEDGRYRVELRMRHDVIERLGAHGNEAAGIVERAVLDYLARSPLAAE